MKPTHSTSHLTVKFCNQNCRGRYQDGGPTTPKSCDSKYEEIFIYLFDSRVAHKNPSCKGSQIIQNKDILFTLQTRKSIYLLGRRSCLCNFFQRAHSCFRAYSMTSETSISVRKMECPEIESFPNLNTSAAELRALKKIRR